MKLNQLKWTAFISFMALSILPIAQAEELTPLFEKPRETRRFKDPTLAGGHIVLEGNDPMIVARFTCELIGFEKADNVVPKRIVGPAPIANVDWVGGEGHGVRYTNAVLASETAAIVIGTLICSRPQP